MANLIEKIIVRIGGYHARSVHRRFLRELADVRAAQQRAMQRCLAVVERSAFGRANGLQRVRTPDDLRRALPLRDYEDFRPTIDRVCDGDAAALFSPGVALRMFATSSGTTAAPKRVPVTAAFEQDYRRGWNVFGYKLLDDHPPAIFRGILQSTGRMDSSFTPSGIPCGAITGLLARTQKPIVRHLYAGHPRIAYIDSALDRYYVLMRLAIERDVAFAITANPATLVTMARVADQRSETLIRDVRDGAICAAAVPDVALRRSLAERLRPNPGRAAELERLRRSHGALRPSDYWRLTFLACWTGGSMGYYLERLASWWGPAPVRDIGLLASESRVSLPLDDGTPAGPLDVSTAVFEFIPAERALDPAPPTLWPHELEAGREYAVVLSNTTGLLRYRLHDVVAVRGWVGQAPIIEFLYRAGGVASVAGEKLTENQVVAAMRAAVATEGVPEFDYIAAPSWADPPRYRFTTSVALSARALDALDAALCEQNEEYASRRESGRLGAPVARQAPPIAFAELDARLAHARGGSAEQYKRPCLIAAPDGDDRLLGTLSALTDAVESGSC